MAEIAPGCAMPENGATVTGVGSDYAPPRKDCEPVFREGLLQPMDRVRDRRFPAVDVDRGLVLAISVQDMPTRETSFRTTGGKSVAVKREFPGSRLVAELIKIE